MNKLYLLLAVSILASFNLAAQNVGIGIATPTQKLHVSDGASPNTATIRVSGLSGASALAAGTAPYKVVLVDNNGVMYRGGTAGSGNTDAWYTLGNAGLTDGTHFLGTTDARRIDFRTNNTIRMTLSSGGYLGMGTTAPANYIHFIKTGPTGAGIWQTYWENTGTGDALSQWYNSNAANGSRVAMGITNYNANTWEAVGVYGLAINTATVAGAGVIATIGTKGFNNSTEGNGVEGGFVGGTSITAAGWAVYSDGWAGGTTAWQNISDARIKKNVQTIPNALQKVLQLRGVEYNYDKTNYPMLNVSESEKQIGFVAQEVEAVMPELVREANIRASGGLPQSADIKTAANSYLLKTFSYSSIVPILVEALKEQQQIIEDLKTRVEKLEHP